jgi:hypothetical protein
MSEINVPMTVRTHRKKSRLEANNISSVSNAVKSIGPVVGRFSTISVITPPETI